MLWVSRSADQGEAVFGKEMLDRRNWIDVHC
jgi:hypothetical protein